MGGDQAPAIVVEGAHLARRQYPDAHFAIYGDKEKIAPLIAKYPGLEAVMKVYHTPDRVAADEKPAVALRQGRQSSMRLAIDAVAKGEADCVVSAGNTGALMAMAKFSLKSLPGIDRPAICARMPTRLENRDVAFIDLGANSDCDANNLLEFAVLGGVFAREIFKVEQPKIGLLNIGSEAMKGNSLVKETSELFEKSSLPGIYAGYAEGDKIMSGEFDVIVTDGFTGNVALKSIEGTSKLISSMIRQAFKGSWMMKMGLLLALPGIFLAYPAISALKKRVDPRYHNGASFLGLRGLCIKSHGGTDAVGFANAIGVAAHLAKNGFNAKVEAELNRIGHGKKEDVTCAVP